MENMKNLKKEFLIVMLIIALAVALDVVVLYPRAVAKKHVYTEDDCTRITNIVLGRKKPTYLEKTLYDLNDDGVITMTDFLMAKSKVTADDGN